MPDMAIRRSRDLLITAGFVGALAVTLLAFSWWRYGSINSARLVWKGRPISVDSPVQSLGNVPGGAQHRRVFSLKNHSTRPLRLVGSTTTCSCVVPEELPITINPHSVRQLQVLVHVPEVKGTERQFEQEVTLFTDVVTQPKLILRVTGEVSVHQAEAG
jgi:hypothetical protein